MLVKKILFFNMIEEPNLSQANACSDIFASFEETTSRFDKQKRHLKKRN